MAQTKVAQISLFPILLVNFIGTLGYSIILPFLVVLVLKFGGNEVVYGIMGATYSAFQMVGAPILGNWSDRFGRKKILILSQVGTFLAWVFFIVALVLPDTRLFNIETGMLGGFTLGVPLLLLFFARALDGLTGGNVSVANAYLADITPERERKGNFGKMAASANLGFIIGPAFAGLLGATVLEEKLPVLMAMTISLIAIFVIALLMPESHSAKVRPVPDECKMRKVLGQEQKECYKMPSEERMNFRGVLKLPKVPFFITLYFLIFLAFNFFYVAFPLLAVKSYQWSLFRLGLFFSLIGLVMAIVQGPVLSRISDRISEVPLTVAGSLLLAASFFMLLLRQEAWLFVSAVSFSVGNGLMWPSFLSLLSSAAGERFQGAVQGYASSAGSLASIVGLVVGGVIFAQLQTLTFFIPAVMMLIIAVLSMRLLRSV